MYAGERGAARGGCEVDLDETMSRGLQGRLPCPKFGHPYLSLNSRIMHLTQSLYCCNHATKKKHLSKVETI